MIKYLLFTIMLLNIVACGTTDKCQMKNPANDSRPDILIIGDSISYGYWPHIKAALPGYDVIHNPCNAQDSRTGRAWINSWLKERPTYAAILFNHTAWDVSFAKGINGSEYETNMLYIAQAIKSSGFPAMYVNGIHVPVNDKSRSIGSEVAYNTIAENIMSALSIPVADAYTVSTGIPHLYKRAAFQDDVHLTDAGSLQLANEILLRLDQEYGIH